MLEIRVVAGEQARRELQALAARIGGKAVLAPLFTSYGVLRAVQEGLTNAVNRTSSFGGGSRPNSTGRSAKLEGPAQQRLARWFDTSAFTEPAPFTFGNVARTLSDVRSHGVNNFDFALFKNTQMVAEPLGLQFRVEVFNLFNRVQFGYPGRQLGNPQFGVISGQYNNPRLVQFALRLLF